MPILSNLSTQASAPFSVYSHRSYLNLVLINTLKMLPALLHLIFSSCKENGKYGQEMEQVEETFKQDVASSGNSLAHNNSSSQPDVWFIK